MISINNRNYKFKIFTEDVGSSTRKSVAAAKKSEEEAIDSNEFSPPECHTACAIEANEDIVKIFTIGGAVSEDTVELIIQYTINI